MAAGYPGIPQPHQVAAGVTGDINVAPSSWEEIDPARKVVVPIAYDVDRLQTSPQGDGLSAVGLSPIMPGAQITERETNRTGDGESVGVEVGDLSRSATAARPTRPCARPSPL